MVPPLGDGGGDGGRGENEVLGDPQQPCGVGRPWALCSPACTSDTLRENIDTNRHWRQHNILSAQWGTFFELLGWVTHHTLMKLMIVLVYNRYIFILLVKMLPLLATALWPTLTSPCPLLMHSEIENIALLVVPVHLLSQMWLLKGSYLTCIFMFLPDKVTKNRPKPLFHHSCAVSRFTSSEPTQLDFVSCVSELQYVLWPLDAAKSYTLECIKLFI